MKPGTNRCPAALIAALCGLGLAPGTAAAQAPEGVTLEATIAPGNNYDKAEFKLWYPKDAATLQAVLVLVPGSNGDGRAQADDPVWQAFAERPR